MKISSISILIGWALLLVSMTGAAADEGMLHKNAVGVGGFLSSDSEGFSAKRFVLEYLPHFQNADSYSGIRYTKHSYKQNNWSRDGQQFALTHRNVDHATANGWSFNAGLFHQDRHRLLTLDGNYRNVLASQTSMELIINREAVETIAALDKGVYSTLAGIALDQGVGTHITLVGLAARQDFSDGNARNHGRLKFIYQPDLDSGLTLQVRYRQYNSTSNNVGGTYFNPERYNETLVAIGWRKRIQGWSLSLTGGIGEQKVAADPYSRTYLVEAGLQSPPGHPYSIRIRAAANQSAAFLGPHYRYNYLQGDWIIPF